MADAVRNRAAVTGPTPASTLPVREFFGGTTLTRFAVMIWLITAAVMLLSNWASIAALTLFDPDDQLRLVQVRDLLGGQGWWDLTQHRINPAHGGVLMHWSRIVDTPLAIGIGALTPVLGGALAERIVLALVPLLTLGGVFALARRAYATLADRPLAICAIVLLATDNFILFQLTPMRIDHHGWQILLGLGLLANALQAQGLRNGIIGGLTAATLLAISLEGLPMVVLFAGLAGGEWLVSGRPQDRRRLTGFLAGLGLGAVVVQFVTRGPAGMTGLWCDALSLPYIAAFVVAGAAVAAGATMVDRRGAGPAARFAVLAAAGAAAATALLLVAPQCAAGPFATLDPLVVQYWYSKILEGQPIWRVGGLQACYAVAPTMVGLLGTGMAWRGARDPVVRRRWAIMGIALIAAVILSVLVLRTGSTAHAYALPGCAWLGIAAWRWSRSLTRASLRIVACPLALVALPSVSGLVSAWVVAHLSPTNALIDEMANGLGSGADDSICLSSANAALLRRLSPATIMTPLDIGPMIVRLTPHSVVATGHHRNNLAMAATIGTFIGPAATAEAKVRAAGATMVVVCTQANDFQQYRAVAGDSLADDLATGRTPAWLTPVPMVPGTTLRAWRLTTPPG